jgi:T1SS-143 domain-containing protein
MNEFVRIAQAAPASNSGNTQTPAGDPVPLVLTQPSAQQSVVSLRSPGQLIDFRQILDTDISFFRIGDDLQMIFADGGILIVQNFFLGDSGSQVALVGDEQVLSLDEFGTIANVQSADEIQTAAGETANLATALGGPQGSGQNFQDTSIEGLGGGSNNLDLLGPGGVGGDGFVGATPADPEVDTVPTIDSGADAGSIDEGNLAEGNEAGQGPLVATGSLGINFGENAGPSPTLEFDVNGAGIPLDASGAPLDLSSDGIALVYTIVSNGDGGQTLTAAKAGTGEVVFTVTIEIVPDVFDGGASGATYTFTLFGNLDHLGTGVDDLLPVSFSVTAEDTDGDAIGTDFTVNILDDDAEIGDPEDSSVDEDGLTGGNVDSGYDGDLAGSAVTSAGDLAISWGADDSNPTAGGGTGDRSVAFSASQPGLAGLTSNGAAVSIAVLADGTLVGYTGTTAPTASGDASVVFFATLSDAGSGSYAFTLSGNLDHPTPDTEDDIDLVFAFTATDGDGDTTSSTFTVTVDDDAPVIGDAEDTSVDEDGLAGGNDGEPAAASYAGSDLAGEAVISAGDLAISWGADNGDGDAVDDETVGGRYYSQDIPGGNGNRSVTFSTTTPGGEPDVTATAGGQALGGPLTSAGETVKYVMNEDGTALFGYTGPDKTFDELFTQASPSDPAEPTDEVVFVVTLSDEGSGGYIFELLKPLDHPEAGTEDDIDLTFGFTATDGDGDTASSTFTVTVDDDAPEFAAAIDTTQVDEEGLGGGNAGESYPGNPGDFAGEATVSGTSLNISWGADNADDAADATGNSGALLLQDAPGADGDRSVTFTTDGSGAPLVTATRGTAPLDGGLTSAGEDVKFVLNDDGTILLAYTGADASFNDLNGAADAPDAAVVFRVSLTDEGTGAYSFELLGTLDHDLGGADSKEDNIRLEFGFTAKDSDGDTIADTFRVIVDDDAPEFAAAIDTTQVDEEGLGGGNAGESYPGNPGDFAGEATVSGTSLNISWGADNADDAADAMGNSGALLLQDAPGADGDRSVTFTTDGSGAPLVTATRGTAPLDGGLTSAGADVKFVLNDDGTILLAYTGADASFNDLNGAADAPDAAVVFRVSLTDEGTGAYSFELLGTLDHDLGGADSKEDNIRLELTMVL